MQIIFHNIRTNRTLTMPVTPPDFYVEEGRLTETLEMASFGQVNLPGLRSLFNERLEFLLPSSPRSYTAGGWTGDPYAAVDLLRQWSLDGDVLRLIATGTPVNVPVLLGPVRYGERDGTGDVYVTLELRQHRELAEERTEANPDTGNLIRSAPREEQAETACTVASGDTLWGICRRHYGDGALARRLAAFNGIKNANLIYPGQTVRLPDRSRL